MKKRITVLIPLILILLISYFLIGWLVHRTLTQQVEALPQNQLLSLTLKDYQQGWFASSANLLFKMHVPKQQIKQTDGQINAQPPADMSMEFPLRIDHGPLIWTKYGIRFGLGQVSTQPETRYSILVNYLNQSVIQFSLPGFTMQNKTSEAKDSFILHWQGADLRFCVSSAVDKITGYMHLNGMHFESKAVNFKLGKIIHNFAVDYQPPGLWLGKADFSLPEIEVKAEQAPVFELKDLNVQIQTGQDDQGLNTEFGFDVERIKVQDKNYGPGDLQVEILHLNTEAMAKINQLQMKLLNEAPPSNLTLLAIIAELPKLISNGARLKVMHKFVIPQGKISANLSMTLPKQTAGQSPEQWAAQVQGQGQVKAPAALVRELLIVSLNKTQPQQQSQPQTDRVEQAVEQSPVVSVNPSQQADSLLAKWTKEGILTQDQQDYVINFEIKNREIMVNGQRFSPAMLGL